MASTPTSCNVGTRSVAALHNKSSALPFANRMAQGKKNNRSIMASGTTLLTKHFGLAAAAPCSSGSGSSSGSSSSSRGQAVRCRASAVSESTMAVTEAQEEACRAFLDAQGGAGSDASALEEKAAALLVQAATRKDVAPPLVLGAMVWLERHASSPVALDVLSGTWRLVFSSATPIKAFQYIPVHEDAVVDPASGSIDLVSFIGPLETRFLGTFEWRGPAAASSGAGGSGNADMEFGFGRIKVTLGPFSLVDKEVAEPKMKIYRYYWRRTGAGGEEIVLARSSGGGLTLLLRS